MGASSHGPPSLGGPVNAYPPPAALPVANHYVHPQNSQLPAFPYPPQQSPPQLQPTVDQSIVANAIYPIVNQQGRIGTSRLFLLNILGF